jgi:nucleolar protein 15
MKKYFSQFGDIKRLRLSRNKKTGASKHYAFIEFRHGEVADIVAQAMNNYLMFGHILQCRVVPSEQVHEELFKGSNERFKVDPRNKKAGNAMARGAERATWEKRVEKENKKRASKTKALKDEFDYSFTAPTVTTVDAVPKKLLAIEDEAEQQLLDEAPQTEVTETVQFTESTPDQLTISETVKVKKTKKAAKSKSEPEPEATAIVHDEPAPAAKGKKERKRKSDVTAEIVEEPVAAPKAKKAKKAKA